MSLVPWGTGFIDGFASIVVHWLNRRQILILSSVAERFLFADQVLVWPDGFFRLKDTDNLLE